MPRRPPEPTALFYTIASIVNDKGELFMPFKTEREAVSYRHKWYHTRRGVLDTRPEDAPLLTSVKVVQRGNTLHFIREDQDSIEQQARAAVDRALAEGAASPVTPPIERPRYSALQSMYGIEPEPEDAK